MLGLLGTFGARLAASVRSAPAFTASVMAVWRSSSATNLAGRQGVIVGPPCGAGVLRDGRGLGLGEVQREPVRAQLISHLTVMLSPGGDNRAVHR